MYCIINSVASMGVTVQGKNVTWQDAATVRTRLGADVVLNAQMWNFSTQETSYALKVGGALYGKDDGAWIWGYGWQNGETTLHWDSADHMDRWDNYLGCERIVDRGAVCIAESTQKAYAGRRGRTGLGVTASGEIACVCVSDSTPITLQELAEQLLALGCETGIMLDGGGSSQLITPGSKVSSVRKVQSLFWVRFAACPYAEPTATIQYGNTGDGVRWMQWMLNRQLLVGDKLTVDGVYGPATRTALVAFQAKYKMDASGVCGPVTRSLLRHPEQVREISGVDCATPLTVATAAAIHAAGHQYVGRYMVPESYGYKALKPEEVAAIHAAGLAILPIWETTGRRAQQGAPAGTADGIKAVRRAHELGLPSNSCIYFAETDYGVTSGELETVVAYLRAAANAMAPQYQLGVYGSFAVVEAAIKAGVVRHAWQCYAWSEGKLSPHAETYQHTAGQRIGGVEVDVNACSDMATAGFWMPEDAPPAGPAPTPEDPEPAQPAPSRSVEERLTELEQRVTHLENNRKG